MLHCRVPFVCIWRCGDAFSISMAKLRIATAMRCQCMKLSRISLRHLGGRIWSKPWTIHGNMRSIMDGTKRGSKLSTQWMRMENTMHIKCVNYDCISYLIYKISFDMILIYFYITLNLCIYAGTGTTANCFTIGNNECFPKIVTRKSPGQIQRRRK